MTDRIFDNPQRIGRQVATLRIRTLDPLAVVNVYNSETILIDSDLTLPAHFVQVESSLTDEQINNLLDSPEAIDEQQMIADYVTAADRFKNLPQWATWNADQAAGYVNDNIFAGLTQIQVDAQIDALPATIAGMKTGLKQISTAILTIRSILINVAKAIVFLRDLVVSLRR